MTDLHENELIDRILAGELTLFDILIKRYQVLAFNIALRIVNDREDAEEIAHDGFIKAYKGLHNFKKDSKFSTWLYSIVYHTAISFTRKKSYLHSDTKLLEKRGKEDKLQIELDDRTRYINLALEELERDDREILQLFYLREMSLEEISEFTETSVNTLKVRLHRARKKMADKMKLMLKEEALNL